MYKNTWRVCQTRVDKCLPKYRLSKSQRVLNTSTRLIYCAPKSCHITPLLRELHWLPVCYRIEYNILLLTFKVLYDMSPDYLRQLIFVLPPSKYDLRRNFDSGILLASPKVKAKITLGDRLYTCAAPRLWNLLPSTMRSISSLNLFKKDLKLSYLVTLLIRNFSIVNLSFIFHL